MTMKRPCGWKLPLVIFLVGASPVASSTRIKTAPLSKGGHEKQKSIGSIHRRHDLTYTIVEETGKRGPLEAAVGRWFLPSLLSGSCPGLLVSSSSVGHSTNSNEQKHPSSVVVSRGVTAMKRVLKIPPFLVSKLRERNPPKNAGYYYGLQPDKIFPYQSTRHQQENELENQQLAMTKTLTETLEEMKNMRKELQLLRREMYEMRKKITGEQDLELEGVLLEEDEAVDPEVARLAQQKRQRQYDRIGGEVEDWARKKLFEEDREGNGWVEVSCNKVISKTVNPDGRTTCFINWMKDSRGKHAFPNDDREYPCLKVYSTIDAPLEDVCTYLSREEHMADYNYILTQQKDLEEIAPHSKICWATSPQVLFIKPRDFVTFVYHRWLKDGSVVLINQACEHKDAPAVTEEGKGKACRAYALRGATFFSPDPKEPNKTHLAMIAHAAPGGDFPQWMTKTAVNAIAPLEPFKLFHHINQNVLNSKKELEKLKLQRMEQVSIPGRSNQPVGIAQIGFACFWPNGGGLLPGASSSTTSLGAKQSSNSTIQSPPEPTPVASVSE